MCVLQNVRIDKESAPGVSRVVGIGFGGASLRNKVDAAHRRVERDDRLAFALKGFAPGSGLWEITINESAAR
jgi:hypothetical protein